MIFRPSMAITALTGMIFLAGCQTGETLNTGAPADQTKEQDPANGQSREGDGAAAYPIKPDQATLETFLARGVNSTPHVHGAEAESGPAQPLAKTTNTQACTITYNDRNIINTLPNKAWDTFAWAPHYNMTCASAFWIYTLPMSPQNHHHLMYEDPAVCPSLNLPARVGRYAYPLAHIPGKCDDWNNPPCILNNIDPATLPRFLSPHTGSDIDQIYVIDKVTRNRRVFNMNSLDIKPSDAAAGCHPNAGKLQLWFKIAASQQWMYWSVINPGQTFYPGNYGLGWDEMRLTSPYPPYGWGVDNIKMDVVY